jgi:hypothetical protein
LFCRKAMVPFGSHSDHPVQRITWRGRAVWGAIYDNSCRTRVAEFLVPQEEGGQMPELEEWLPEEVTCVVIRQAQAATWLVPLIKMCARLVCGL